MKRFGSLAILVLSLFYGAANVDARYFDPVEGRFLSEDPAGFVDGPNKYTYVHNNPVNYVDPDGLTTAVIYNGPTNGNPFGHTAIAFEGGGIYSFGNNYPLGGSLSAYLLREAPRRDTKVVILNTTPEQEAQMTKYLLQLSNKPLQKWPGNCAERTSGAMQSAGLPYSEAYPTSWPLSVLYQALGWKNALGGATYSIPKGSTQIPQILYRY